MHHICEDNIRKPVITTAAVLGNQMPGSPDLALGTLLMRPTVLAELEKEIALLEENYGSVPHVYLICENDIVTHQRFQNCVIHQRFQNCDEVKMISGADHMAMFSKPKELCFFLQERAEKY
ncbi:methylesterase 3-like [Olea europaea var. sylvestris]|uniref:Uncharacterized protein n=1 Tax=Olea europaea subsp. europaea TaxID=158383 RepID=A0A8S0R6B7_OLEEU|nr:methylesterase 3-like [Olea europaea var. sylvestris]CAA2975016.1 Hypothetical predicted protein [Olea europaea subsp. europaea]